MTLGNYCTHHPNVLCQCCSQGQYIAFRAQLVRLGALEVLFEYWVNVTLQVHRHNFLHCSLYRRLFTGVSFREVRRAPKSSSRYLEPCQRCLHLVLPHSLPSMTLCLLYLSAHARPSSMPNVVRDARPESVWTRPGSCETVPIGPRYKTTWLADWHIETALLQDALCLTLAMPLTDVNGSTRIKHLQVMRLNHYKNYF